MMNSVNSSPTASVSILLAVCALALQGCGSGADVRRAVSESAVEQTADDTYVIGPGDGLQVFVWGHEDLSTSVQVRPDGNISTPLVEDLRASGRTPTQLARALEEVLSEFVRSPTVTIIVQGFVGELGRQIRVVGEAAEPQALPYRQGMSLLDVMIQVGGLSEFAAGNRAKIVRREDGREIEIKVRIKDLLSKGDMKQNVRMMPGDVVIIPESFF